MSEETQVQEQQVEQTNQTPEVDPYEAQAREQGWKPKEEYEGDPSKWREAKEFVERGELFGKIDSMGKELKETRKALKMLQEHHSKVKETEFQNAMKELRTLQKKHLEEGNSDEYLKTTEIITDLRAEQKAREIQSQAQSNQPDPRFNEWVNANKWYETDKELREFADTIGAGYAQRNPGTDPEDVLEYVSTQVKSRYKEKFQNPNRTKPNSVEGNSSPANTKGQITLSDEEKKVMNTFIRQGVMTKDQYLAEIKKMRG